MFDLDFLILLLLNLLFNLAFFVLAMVYFFVEAREITKPASKKVLLISVLISIASIGNALMMRYLIVFPKTESYDLNSTYNLVVNIISAIITFFTTILYLRAGQGLSHISGLPGSKILDSNKDERTPINWKYILLPIPILIIWSFVWFGLMPTEPTELALASSPEGEGLMVYVYIFFTASILAPITEEILYRHFAMGLLARWFGKSKAAVVINIGITSLIFAMAHAGVVTSDWIKIVQILPAGILFGWMNYKKGLEYSILSHSAYNTLVIPASILIEHFFL
ncbi:MAG: CPBP family intramembrane metalloprotease [Clostridiales bacterium]|nr:CPBP family intramembrane metalloprotease [Clostridiales bacterium]